MALINLTKLNIVVQAGAKAMASTFNAVTKKVDDVIDYLNVKISELSTSITDGINAERQRAIGVEQELRSLFTTPTASAINAWLNSHPEATTTVQDGSISQSKLSNDVAARIGYWKSVLEYEGATFTNKLQAAIDDTANKSLILFVPQGNYTLTETISVPSNAKPFKLFGQPSFSTNGSSIITCEKGFITLSNNVSIEIKDFALVGSSENSGYTAINTVSQRWLKLSNLYIRKFSTGVYLHAPYGVMREVEVNSCGVGVHVHSIGTVVRDCHIHGCTNIGIKTDGGNSLLIDGVVQEDNGTHIEINDTSSVVITNSYISDNSNTWLKNNGGTNIFVDNMISPIGSPNEVLNQSSGDITLKGMLYDMNDGINITGGTVDLSGLKIKLARHFIENTNGFVLCNDSTYQIGYSLIQSAADNTCPIVFKGALEETDKVNYAGNPMLAINSLQEDYNPNVDVNKPGIKFHFKVPKRFVGKTIYINMGIETTDSTASVFDAWFVGCALNTSSFVKAQYTLVTEDDSYTRIRFNKSYDFWSFPVIASSEDIYVTICNFNNGTPRSIKFYVKYIYMSEDNSVLIPTIWNAEQ